MTRAITAATDATICGLIRGAQRRLTVLAPALSRPVAEAIVERWAALPADAVSVILDIDPEVYRLGYGHPEALVLLQETAQRQGRAINLHRGIRVGLLIADDITLAYAPTPLLIEAGPTRPDTPNAILLGPVPSSVAAELGEGPRGLAERTVGLDRVEPGQIDVVRADLDRNPPRRFVITQTERVFNAHFEFVEFELVGTAVHRREVPIPSELMGLAGDEQARRLLKTSFRLVDPGDKLSGKHLEEKKTLIAKAFLKSIKSYGTAILRTDKDRFQKEVENLRLSIATFKKEVEDLLRGAMDKQREVLKKALLPGLLRRPPKDWTKAYGGKLAPDLAERLLDQALRQAFGSTDRWLREMKLNVVFKGVTYESLCDPAFVEAATKAMPTLAALHHEWQAARAAAPPPTSRST
jgi:hypothetical protein